MSLHSRQSHRTPQSQTYLFDSDEELKMYIIDSDEEVVIPDSDIEENNPNKTQQTPKQKAGEEIQLPKSRSIEARFHPSKTQTDAVLETNPQSDCRHHKRSIQERRRGHSKDSNGSHFDLDPCKADDKNIPQSPRPDRSRASWQISENIIQKQDSDDDKVELGHDDITASRSDRCKSPVCLSSNEAASASTNPPRKRTHSATGDAEGTFSTSHSWRNAKAPHSNSTIFLNEQSEDEPLEQRPESKRPKPPVHNPSNLGAVIDGHSKANASPPTAGASRPAYRIPNIIPACEPNDLGQYESSTCHQCRVKTTRPKMICDQSQDPNCVVRVCIKCLMRRGVYDDHPELQPPIFSFVPGGRMLCVKCRNLCPCISCRRRRGEKEECRRGLVSSTNGFYGLALEEREKLLLMKEQKRQAKRGNEESRPSNEKTRLTSSSNEICGLTSNATLQHQGLSKKRRSRPEDSDGSDFNPGIRDEQIISRSPRPNRSRVSLGKRIESGIWTHGAVEAPQQLEGSYGLTPKERLQALSKKRKIHPVDSDGSDFNQDIPGDTTKPQSPRPNHSSTSRHNVDTRKESEIEAYGDIEEPRQIAVDRDDRTASRANIHDSHGHLPSGYPPEASTSPARSCILSGTSVKSKRPKSASKNPVNLGHATIGPSRSNPSPIAGSSKLVYRTPKNIPARESDEFGRYESSCCHQCQVNTTQPKMICDQSQDPNCVVRVCITCLTKSKVYDDHVELRPPIFKFTPGGRMLCVKCRDVCPCASCRRGRSEKDHSSRGSDSSAHDFCVLALEEREEFSSKKQARHEPKRQKQESRPSVEKTLCSHSQFDVSLDAFTQWKNSFDRDDKAQLASTLLSKQNIPSALLNRKAISVDKQVFSNTLTAQATPATNQKPNGRCWLFATCNLARMGIVKKFDLGDFELSQSRLVFYDFLEKADFYLKSMIELVELPIDARIISHISGSPLGDGGQWDMAAGLIEKYGLVPQPIYDDSFNYLNSSGINAFLTSKLRDQALELRQIYKDAKAHAADNLGQDSESATIAGIRAARQAKETMMTQVYRCLAIALGSPPSPTESFKWDYVDKSGKAHSLVSTPLDFYHKHCAGFQASEYISLINDPRNPYNKSYTIERVGNIWGGRPIRHVNTSPDVLKSSVIKMIQADKPVWLGCDASKMSDLSHGIMDTKLIDYKATFGVTSRLSKSDRLRMGDGVISHVMVITAVHLDEEGKPVRYKAENSWSDTAGPHGCFVMTDAWFDEYVYQIVLPKSFTSDLLREIYDDPEPSVLPPWDPMASLA